MLSALGTVALQTKFDKILIFTLKLNELSIPRQNYELTVALKGPYSSKKTCGVFITCRFVVIFFFKV